MAVGTPWTINRGQFISELVCVLFPFSISVLTGSSHLVYSGIKHDWPWIRSSFQ